MIYGWVSRTDDDDSMGFISPATAEHIGYANAKENGQLKYVDGNSYLEFYIEAGWLEPDKALSVKQKIEQISK